MKTIVSICSARPNFVKLASVHQALAKKKDIQHIIIHTGQHYSPQLSDIFFEQLGIPAPQENLGVRGQEREQVIQKTKEALIPVLQKLKPDTVLVYGDVNGALGSAQAAHSLGIPLAHVEAGLRSGDLDMPEEHNRMGIDELADILFVTEKSGEENLKHEKRKGVVHFVGNTMIDTLLHMMPLVNAQKDIFEDLADKKFILATLHRPSNVDDPATLQGVLEFFKDVGKAAGMQIFLPAHPRLQEAWKKVQSQGDVHAHVRFSEPYGYAQFLAFAKHAAFILTDSGGIQEEAVVLGKRCFTLRRNTERPSTIESGSNVLIDPSSPSDRQTVFSYAKNPVAPTIKIPALWDGKAGERIADILC